MFQTTTFFGENALIEHGDFFKQQRLLSKLKAINSNIIDIQGIVLYFLQFEKNKESTTLNSENLNQLKEILFDVNHVNHVNDKNQVKHELSITITPRIGTISPWSSKTLDILKNCGFSTVLNRIEKGIVYTLTFKKPISKNEEINKILKPIYSVLHDRMTESCFEGEITGSDLFIEKTTKPLEIVPLLEQGKTALELVNKQWGLALSDVEIDYLYTAYTEQIKRNSTDAELMMFAQANSEHCRHKIFNANWNIDGENKENTLFGMIRNTHKQTPENTIVAYADNSAVMNGTLSKRLMRNEMGTYREVIEDSHILMKVETHNHPTAISPFAGASTGSGGEIRDEGATGIGGRPKAGLCGFTVSNLHLPDLPQVHEQHKKQEKKEKQSIRSFPENISTPLQIMTEGPLGAAAFNNEFGRPNLVGYFRVYEQAVNNTHFGYHKPIMIAGGMGAIRGKDTHKSRIPTGALLIQLGGPSMRIGLGGGAASSLDTGTNDIELDFDSVQRGNPEMQRRCQEVIDFCWSADKNPVIAIHDVGAGGLSNAFPELIHDAQRGGIFNLTQVAVEEAGMTAKEIWSNESQERYVLSILPQDLAVFEAICSRERCPFSVVGTATEQEQLQVLNFDDSMPINLPLDVFLGKIPQMRRIAHRHHFEFKPMNFLTHITAPSMEGDMIDQRNSQKQQVSDELLRLAKTVLQHPTVASKKFLITIGDRTVGGLTARDQMVGSYQIPVADCALTLADYQGFNGEAMAMGERTPLAIQNAPASARMAVMEALTNLLSAPITDLKKVKLSANWMAACGQTGQDGALYEAVEAIGLDFCPKLGLSIPVGKDSLSMKTVWQDNAVMSPVSLIVSSFASIEDVRLQKTPQLVELDEETVLLVLQPHQEQRLAGSILSQILQDYGNETPDIEGDQAQKFISLLMNIKPFILAYHDRSDGGIWATLCEMAFTLQRGLEINLDMLSFDKHNQDWGDYKVKEEQILIQRFEAAIKGLFNEEIGVVVQVKKSDERKIMELAREQGLSAFCHRIATLSMKQGSIRFDGKIQEKNDISVWQDGKLQFSINVLEAFRLWNDVGYQIVKNRDNPLAAQTEYAAKPTAIHGLLTENAQNELACITEKLPLQKRPKIAILREQGVNGHMEMAAAFHEVGFEAIDVHMSDLLAKRHQLKDFAGLVACGGFSYGDVLGAGAGWAKTILFNDDLKKQFTEFFHDERTFALGICNGCQMLSRLSSLMPQSEHVGQFVRNHSQQFEARLSVVKIDEEIAKQSIFLKNLAGCVLPVVVSHGEGRYINCNNENKNQYVAINYVEPQTHQLTEQYPYNPNGSENGATGVITGNGRILMMMPHPERTFRSVQYSYNPFTDLNDSYSPWILLFQNAYDFVKNFKKL